MNIKLYIKEHYLWESWQTGDKGLWKQNHKVWCNCGYNNQTWNKYESF